MSNALLNVLRKRTDIKGPAKAILYVLADRANEGGECWLSHASIAQESGLGKSTVKKHLKLLKSGNEIRWTEQFTIKGDQDSNLYVITLGGGSPDNPPPPRGDTPRSPGGLGVGHEVAEGGSPRSYKAPIKHPSEAPEVNISSPVELFPSEKSPKPSKRDATSKAEEIYQKYPRHEARKKAMEAICKAMAKHDPAMLLEKVTEYAEAITWKEKRFIPHPATWFNDERFLDDPAEWRSPPPQSLKKFAGTPEQIEMPT